MTNIKFLVRFKSEGREGSGERRAEDEDHKGGQHRLLDGVVAIQAFIILWFF